MVGREGFEPSKDHSNGVTVRPIWPLWNLPKTFKELSLQMQFLTAVSVRSCKINRFFQSVKYFLKNIFKLPESFRWPIA